MTNNIFADTPAPIRLQMRPFRHVSLLLVGCGGTGSHLLSGIVTLMMELEARGISCDLTLCDPDKVEKKNVGRQLFSAGEIGMNKAQALARRALVAYGRVVQARGRALEDMDILMCGRDVLSIVIGAVDNPEARAIIAQNVDESMETVWWLDCGNENYSGQIALGNTGRKECLEPEMGMIANLPSPDAVYPDLIATKAQTARPAASCATALASGDQGLMVNRMVAAWALAMLDAFLLRGDLRYHAVDFDLLNGGVKSRAIDEEMARKFS